MSLILLDIERRGPLELCNIELSPLTTSASKIICNIGCLLGMSLKPSYRCPVTKEAWRTLYTRVANDLPNATILNVWGVKIWNPSFE
jgi:hypothetical protein